jgi:hypothetical protein
MTSQLVKEGLEKATFQNELDIPLQFFKCLTLPYLTQPSFQYLPNLVYLMRPSPSSPEESQDETSHRGKRPFQQDRRVSGISQTTS